MVDRQDCRVSNPTDNLLISDVLKLLVEMSVNQNSTSSVIGKKEIAGSKGEIVTAIILGMASSAVYDFIKTILKRLINRKDYDPALMITINNVVVTLDDITKK